MVISSRYSKQSLEPYQKRSRRIARFILEGYTNLRRQDEGEGKNHQQACLCNHNFTFEHLFKQATNSVSEQLVLVGTSRVQKSLKETGITGFNEYGSPALSTGTRNKTI